MKRNCIIGIDTGTHTGLAVWNCKTKKLDSIKTMKIHEAMKIVLDFHVTFGDDLFVRFEDARLRTWFGNAGREQLQGAGSIKRDCSIWQDFLEAEGIAFEAVAPKLNKTKLSADQFKRITGCSETTTEHSRDAAMLVIGL
jgi:hypothetical protein